MSVSPPRSRADRAQPRVETPSASPTPVGVSCPCGAELELPDELRDGLCGDCRMFCEVCGELVGVIHGDGRATLCDGCEERDRAATGK